MTNDVSSSALDPVERSYRWFNSLNGRKEPVTADEVANIWTEDGTMIANGQVKCSGIPALTAHFNELCRKLRSWRVNLPLAITVTSPDQVGCHYTIDIVTAEGQEDRIHVVAFFEVRNGKLAHMTEVVSFEKAEMKLENH